jgi:subtilisin family serine protease
MSHLPISRSRPSTLHQRACAAILALLLAASTAAAQAPNDQFYPQSWHHQKIGSESAWNISSGSRSVIVAVIDSGVDPTHPEFAGHLVSGWNFNTQSSNTSPIGPHGTGVAGVIAATRNNTIGVAGVADVSIMPIIVSPDPNGMSDLDATLGIRWAADHGAKVINISAGLSQGPLFHEAVTYAWERGSLVVVATANIEDGGPQRWADVITVSASDQSDNRHNSQWGAFLDILAPGKDIYTTYWDPAGQARYAIGQGTSFGAPMVSGAAALAWSINPDLTNAQVRDLIYATATDLGAPGYDQETGWGRLDIGALATAASATVPEPTSALLILLSAATLLRRRRQH